MDTQESLISSMSLFSALPNPFDSEISTAATETVSHFSQERLPQERLPQERLPQEKFSQERFPQEAIAQFFNFASNPLAILGFDGSVKQGNLAFGNLLGDGLSQVQVPVDLSWFDLIHSDDLATVQQQWHTLIQSTSTGQISIRFRGQEKVICAASRTENGSCEAGCCTHRWMVWQMTPIVNQQLVYAVGQDISEYCPVEPELCQHTALQQANRELEQRVAERTAQLEQANVALTEREALYRTLAQHIPNGAVLLFDRNLRYLLAEGDGLARAGLDRTNLIGKTLYDIFPTDTCAVIAPYYRAALTGQSTVHEIPFQGQIYESRTVPIRNEQGEIFAGMVLSQNITDRSRNETLLATQNYILELITTGASLAEILETLAHLIETQSDEAICSILLLDETQNRLQLVASPGLPQSCCKDLAAGVPINPIDTICGTAAYTRQTVIVSDIDTESRWAESIALLRKYGLQACWSTPILNSQGRVLGTFALYYRTPRQPNTAEQRLITIASHLAGVAIERQRSGEALKQREDQLRLITETIPQQVWTATPEGQVDYYNQRWCEFTGKTLDQLQNEGWTEIVHPDDLPHVSERWAISVKTGSEYQAEARLLSADGEYHWILGQARPLRNSQGQIVKWYGTNTDITERKQAEAALQESEQRLQAILNQSEAVIYLKDTQGRYLLVNRQYETLYQKTQTQLQGQTNRAVFEPETADLFWSHDLEVLETRVPLKFEERVYLPDGVHTYLSVKFPLINSDGIPYAVCGISTDITDRKQIELERERYAEQSYRLLQQEQAARAQAEQANRIKDEFLAVLSHELRTPLNPVLGWSKLLQSRQLSPEKVQQGLETIERNVKLQVQLIDDLLDISRILRGKMALSMAPVSLKETLASALETVRLTAEAKAIQLTTQGDAPMLQVFGDASRLQQILWNLLSNAIKFTPQGGQVTVRLSTDFPCPVLAEAQAACQIPWVRIQVSDTGKGISPEFLPHVFEHFRQQDSSTTRQFGGLGLGLAIVRQLVEAHGGKVAVESAGEGQGTTFSVYLPLLVTAQPETLSGEPTAIDRGLNGRSNGRTARDLQGIRVLLVDDDADTQAFIVYLLGQQQIRVTPVSSAAKAIAALDASTFDVLISDIGMPETDGYTLMHQIRRRPAEQGGTLPAIALTAYASEIDQQQAIAAGFQQHLAKPLALEALIQAIGKLVKSMDCEKD